MVKTSDNALEYQCQGTTIRLPVEHFRTDEWYHLAISWDAKFPPGRLWLTINGKGITAAAEVAVPRKLFAAILDRIQRLRAVPNMAPS